ncbi:hypothetical protein [Isoptericola sp. BMS4]|uniref:hypothetical protein n=1 Tax=Isoptericola sp. BMS4 TaxID=2527875 RepID=UPI00196A464A|nr:hypothetical protein [Isoptericola sp. BMS4]
MGAPTAPPPAGAADGDTVGGRDDGEAGAAGGRPGAAERGGPVGAAGAGREGAWLPGPGTVPIGGAGAGVGPADGRTAVCSAERCTGVSRPVSSRPRIPPEADGGRTTGAEVGNAEPADDCSRIDRRDGGRVGAGCGAGDTGAGAGAGAGEGAGAGAAAWPAPGYVGGVA